MSTTSDSLGRRARSSHSRARVVASSSLPPVKASGAGGSWTQVGSTARRRSRLASTTK